MIKDIVVNLGLGEQDPAGNFAISVAETFEARILGVAVAYEPVIVGSVMGGIPAEFIESQRSEADTKARAAIAHFGLPAYGPRRRLAAASAFRSSGNPSTGAASTICGMAA